MMDAAQGFGGVREKAAFGRESGWEGPDSLHRFEKRTQKAGLKEIAAYPAVGRQRNPILTEPASCILGGQAKPSRTAANSHLCGVTSRRSAGAMSSLASRKDVAQRRGGRFSLQQGLEARQPPICALQILVITSLKIWPHRGDEFAQRSWMVQGGKTGKAEVDLAVNTLFPLCRLGRQY